MRSRFWDIIHDIHYISESDVHGHLRYAERKINEGNDRGYDVSDWEEVVCHVQRELEWRSARRSAHTAYLQSFYGQNY